MSSTTAGSPTPLSRFAAFARRTLRNPEMRAVMTDALGLFGTGSGTVELRLVHAAGGVWREWHAANDQVRELSQTEWPAPSPAALTVKFDDGEESGFVSVSPVSSEAEGLLELLAPQLGTVAMWNNAMRQNRKHRRSETELVQAALRARDDERQRITHELHDDIGQTVATLKLQLKVIEKRLRSEFATADLKDLDDARETAGQLLGRIRSLSHTLYPHVLDTLGLVPALQELSSQVSNPPELRARCRVHGEPRDIGRDEAVALYRCCQEAISNTIRHAAATELDLSIEYSAQTVRVAIEDNGKGFDPRQFYDTAGRLMSEGFWTIRQRMSAVGGSFRVGTSAGQGTSVEVIIPFKKTEAS